MDRYCLQASFSNGTGRKTKELFITLYTWDYGFLLWHSENTCLIFSIYLHFRLLEYLPWCKYWST